MTEAHLVRGWPQGRTHIVPHGQWWRHAVSTALCGKRFSAYESDREKDPTVLAGVTVLNRKPSCRSCLLVRSAEALG